jgi:hypothetical protein
VSTPRIFYKPQKARIRWVLATCYCLRGKTATLQIDALERCRLPIRLAHQANNAHAFSKDCLSFVHGGFGFAILLTVLMWLVFHTGAGTRKPCPAMKLPSRTSPATPRCCSGWASRTLRCNTTCMRRTPTAGPSRCVPVPGPFH